MIVEAYGDGPIEVELVGWNRDTASVSTLKAAPAEGLGYPKSLPERAEVPTADATAPIRS